LKESFKKLFINKNLFQLRKSNRNFSHIGPSIRQQRKIPTKINKIDASIKHIHKKICKDKPHQTIVRTTMSRNTETMLRKMKAMDLKREEK
jgi:hypothetical protein